MRWSSLVVAGPLDVSLRDRLAPHDGNTSVVFRLTNHGDAPLLVDLRSLERVVRPDAPDALHLPLSPAQIHELSEISALTQVRPGASVTYAVLYPVQACDGTRSIAIGGTLAALDGERTLELVADGAQGIVSCEAAVDAPPATMWVTAPGALVAEGTDPQAFKTGFPELLRGASVSDEADVSLLEFSYDPRPIERWRYDACVAAGSCPAREVPQPPGSIRAPAVGMAAVGQASFCSTRLLRAMRPEETTAIDDPARPLLEAAPDGVATTGFRCARSIGGAEFPPSGS